MDTQQLFMLKTHFDLVGKDFLNEFVYRTMFRFATSFWVFVCNYMLYLFGFIIRYFFRFQAGESSQKNDSNGGAVLSQQDNQIGSESNGFRFRFQTGEDSNKSIGETESSVFMETQSTASTSKYQFIYEKDFSGFMEEPQIMSFIVQESYMGSNDNSISKNQILDSHKDFHELNFEAEDSATSFNSEEVLEEQEQVISTDHGLSENEEIVGLENSFTEKHDCSDEFQLLSESDVVCPLDSNPKSSDEFSISNHKFDSVEDELLSIRHVGEGLEPETVMANEEKKVEFIEEDSSLEEIRVHDTSILDREAVVGVDKPEDSDDEYIEFEPHLHNSSVSDKEILSRKDFGKAGDNHEQENIHGKELEQLNGLEKSEEPSLDLEKKSWLADSDDQIGWEILLEHQDLIEQLKMELKNVRTRGLPTILEESESPKIVEDLKPLKIDEKFEHKDRMEEIHKFYKSYAEKMRKLDILNYQTMHAISFLQLKDPVQFISSRKSSIPAIKSLLSQNFWPCKLRRSEADPTLKFIKALHRDLELVYVGQVCLSWEILYWQYGKAQELQEYDCHGFQQYNQVAAEFQQFQVLVQRFVENEPFQGPRVRNYVKNRCVLCSLLHVPIIKDDCLKDKKGIREEGKYTISSAMLTEIIEESVRVFWEFLHGDKDEANGILKGLQGTQVDLQNPADSELLMDIRTNLQKKEKRLKDLLRSGNCIVKKFQKRQEDRLDHVLFFAQVELRLVARVLNMSRLTTDQLLWCHKKLNRINFVNRKIHVEPSFLLFPC